MKFKGWVVIMFNNDIKEIWIKILFTIIGIVSGFIFYEVYNSYRGYRGILFIVLSVIVMIIIVVIERIRFGERFRECINKITLLVKKGANGNIVISPNEEETDEVKELYSSVEDMRLILKQKIRIQTAVIDIINSLAVNIELNKLIDVVLPRLVEETNSNWGVFYVYNQNTDKMELKRSLGLSKNVYREFDVEIGEGFIGIAAMTKEIKIQKGIPPDTVFENRTFLGKVIPKTIMTVPILNQDELMAVMAFASIYEYNDEQIAAITILRNYLGFAVSNCITYERTQRLTNELQFQNELIQNMNDELEKKVGERTDFLNRIINSIKDYLIISVDSEKYVTTWNTGAEKIRGYKAEETIGRYITEFYDSQAEKEHVEFNFEVALREGRFTECCWMTRRDGAEYFADILVTPMYNDNNILQGFTIITKDITDTKNLEQALIYEKAYNEKIVENSTRALLFTDSRGIIINSNKLSDELLAPAGTKIVGRGIFEFFIDSDDMEKSIGKIIHTTRRGETTKEIIYKHDGVEWLTLKAVAMDSDEENIGLLIYITEAI